MRWQSILGRLFAARPRPTSRPRQRSRPTLECLEERTLLNNRFVVPSSVPADNVTTFASLQAALTTAGLAAGDVVQIEPGSAPGNIANNAVPAVANLTIQGDPNAGLASLPTFTVSNSLIISAAQGGFTLKGVNVALIDGGSLVFNANATITGSAVVDVSSTATDAIAFNGTTDVLINSTITDQTNQTLLGISPPTGSSNVVAGNTFVAAASGGNNTLVTYQSLGAVAVSDRIANNTFTGVKGSNVSTFISVTGAVSGLTIQGNTITSGDGVAAGIVLQVTSTGLTVAGNTIHLSGGGSGGGIEVLANGLGPATVTISNNQVASDSLQGAITFTLDTVAANVLNAKVQGNDLHNSSVGIVINQPSTVTPPPVTGIDLGGGSQGSLGGNNFRSFVTLSPNSTAINVSGVAAAQGTVKAQRNLFATGVTPANVVADPNHNLDLSSPLTSNAAFVQTLYLDFLRRTGDTTNAGDAGGWVSYLNAGGSRAAVINAIARSAEALGVLVNGLYLKVLGRAADPGGQAAFVSFLQNGGTVEQTIIFLATSPEYASQAGSDGAFVQSLYNKLLGRLGSNTDVANWVSILPQVGRAGVVNFIVHSAEFRGDVVRQLYAGGATAPVATLFPNLLHRATQPSPSEVNAWVNSPFDVYSITLALAGSGEFFTNG